MIIVTSTTILGYFPSYGASAHVRPDAVSVESAAGDDRFFTCGEFADRSFAEFLGVAPAGQANNREVGRTVVVLVVLQNKFHDWWRFGIIPNLP